MLRGWFDAFRTNGGPTLYTDPNRTAAVEDLRSILIYVTFSTLFVAFLLIFPGIRKERFSTLVCVTTSLFVGAVLFLSTLGTDWHVASTSVSSPYKAFSRELLQADIAVRIGLNSVNITLQAANREGINYNEKFVWVEATQMKNEYRRALQKGLPFPILTIAEYLTINSEGFSWGGKYRKAGYYTSILLWWSLATWLLSNVLLCMVPRYGAYMMLLTGTTVLSAAVIYSLLLPKHPPLVIRFETNGVLSFQYGWCFWVVLAAGTLAFVVGGCVSILDTYFPNKFSTIFEVDYDTPYRYFVGQGAAYPPSPIHPPVRPSASRQSKPPTSPSAFLLASPESAANVSTATEDGGLVNAAFDDDQESCSGTIVDGKRAVSLRHFGKFTQKEASRPKLQHSASLQRKLHSGNGTRSQQRKSSQVNLDLRFASMW